MLFLRFFFSPDLFVYLFLWNGKASGYRRFSSFPLFVSLFLCSSCNITLIISTVNICVLIIFIFFCKPSKINGLQAFSNLEIVIFLRFDTNLTPIFSFLVSEVHCHTIQLCYLVFNPCSVAQVVIHFHSHIKMSVSHDVL